MIVFQKSHCMNLQNGFIGKKIDIQVSVRISMRRSVLMPCGELADHSHPWTPSPMIPLQVAPIADQAFETAIVS